MCIRDSLVPFDLHAFGQLGPAALDDPPVDEEMHHVGYQLVQQALVVRDRQDAELGPFLAHRVHAPPDHP